VFQIFPSVFFYELINFCRWWGLEHFILFDGALGNKIKNFDVSWGQKKNFLRWVVVGSERCLE
jgi:hypothetical protein